MAGTPYVIDSNILIRWVEPSDPDYLITESALDGLATKERFSATPHRTSPSFGTPALGIREFREKLASYLLESDVPVAITRHGDTVGHYIPPDIDERRPSVLCSTKPPLACSNCSLLRGFSKTRSLQTSLGSATSTRIGHIHA